MRIFGLLLLALISALGLGFYGHRLNRLEDAATAYKKATFQYQTRNLALQSVNQMEEALNHYLLRGDRGFLQLMAQPRSNLDHLAQEEVNGQRDPLLANLAAETKKWYEQTAQPMVEARQKLAAGQPLPEHFFDSYAPVDTIGFLFASESAQHSATSAMLEASMNPRWLWLPYPLAGLLMIGVIWLAIGAMKHVSYLKQAAENLEDEDDETDPTHEDGDTK